MAKLLKIKRANSKKPKILAAKPALINHHSTLTLLVARIRANNAHHAATADYLAIATQRLYRCTNSHFSPLASDGGLFSRIFTWRGK
jgi:hypothetical protein